MSIWQAEPSLEDVERQIDIARLLSLLPKRKRAILLKRYGFIGPSELGKDLAAEMKITPQRIYALEQASLKRIRRHCKHYGIRY